MYIYIFKTEKKITPIKVKIFKILGLERIKENGKRDRKKIK